MYALTSLHQQCKQHMMHMNLGNIAAQLLALLPLSNISLYYLRTVKAAYVHITVYPSTFDMVNLTVNFS